MFNFDNNLQPPRVRIEVAHDNNPKTPILYWHTHSSTLRVTTDLPDHCEHQAKFQKTELNANGDHLILKSYADDQAKPKTLVVVPNRDRQDDQVVRFELSVRAV